MKSLQLFALALSAVSGTALAQTPSTPAAVAAPAATAAPASPAPLSEGEVRKVDKAAKKLTLRHGPIRNLDMPAMTMVFQVPDAALLDGLAVGDKLRFHAEQQNGATIVTRVEKVGN